MTAADDDVHERGGNVEVERAHLLDPDVLGNLKAAPIISSALDPVWIGKSTAQDALSGAVPKANKILDDEEKAP